MADAPTAYPLQWPGGWPRTVIRERWPAKITLPPALVDLQREARLLGIKNLVLSSNVTLGSEAPLDPGVVAYGLYDKAQVAIPCDRWTTVAGNVRAITKTIEAMRGMERWGAKQMIRAMFQGFVALPAPTVHKKHWTDVFGADPLQAVDKAWVLSRYRELASTRHPDKPGGSTEAMAELNWARDQALDGFRRLGQ